MPDILDERTETTTIPAPVVPPGATDIANTIETAALTAAVTAWVPRVPPTRQRPLPRTWTVVVAVCVVAASVAFALARMAGANPEPAAAAEALTAPQTETGPAPIAAATPVAPAAMAGPGALPQGFHRWSGTVAGDELTARTAADPEASVVSTLDAVNEFGDPQVVGVVAEALGGDGRAWVRVQLPVRPNGATGWVPASELDIVGHTQRLEVQRSTSTLTLFEGGVVARQWKVAVGPDTYPTPLGPTYLWTKYLDGPASAYGPGVLGLSLFSEVLDASNWPGDARIGIHGAATPGQLGGQAGHGCVRMLNSEVAPLLAELPLGTPVDIVA